MRVDDAAKKARLAFFEPHRAPFVVNVADDLEAAASRRAIARALQIKGERSRARAFDDSCRARTT